MKYTYWINIYCLLKLKSNVIINFYIEDPLYIVFLQTKGIFHLKSLVIFFRIVEKLPLIATYVNIAESSDSRSMNYNVTTCNVKYTTNNQLSL